MNYEELIQKLKSHLGIGKKNAEKVFNKLVVNQNQNFELQNILQEIATNYYQCPICFALTEKGNCLFCQNPSRDQSKLCIVTNLSDVLTFEKAKIFNGVYHVLNYEINIKNGITPEKITFSALEKRMNDKIIKEVIIAVSATFEGEITAQYLKKILGHNDVKISRLARGIPIGGSLDYVDEITLKQALEGRKEI
ncbi:recombination protein RecR [Spiroplasma syrphidicola EA-1]|uniref:Recombination protein RecR n=1 Tax=Spiroplasma syrphidicola EA-1 TaxID=1276229 RepID=R4UCI4_9MOLU|nr:recombination mediator RecR [Spiroplasma syrphidicola]AGM25604.1 recombination protein RecR [Spiroplasma syrphidicola EA-1]